MFRSTVNPSNPLARHSGEGRNPAKKIPREADKSAMLSRFGKTTSHSTKLANNASKVAGYRGDLLINWIPAFAGMTQFCVNGLVGIKFCSAILIVALSGCASHPDTRSVRHKQAMESASQGEKAYLSGKVEQSRQHYEKALQLNTVIENAPGIAANTLSLAQINLDRGEYDQAEAKLQFVLANKENLFEVGVRADAAARSAQMALLLKQTDKADALAQQAQTLCEVSKCILEAVILNLQAQVAFALGELQKSADLAQRAGAKAEKQQQLVELANAWRLLAEIRLRQGAAADAVLLLEKVLPVDKQLGLPKKIVVDLHLMAEAKDKLGQHEEAESYRSRESTIRRALGEKSALGEKLP